MLLSDGVSTRRLKGLAHRTETGSRLEGLSGLLDGAEVIHVQNVMNPLVLAESVSRRRTVVTVQDHRFFCPGPGKLLPDGSVCGTPMDPEVCRACIADEDYLSRTLHLTRRRLEAIAGARVVVLSQYMADELLRAGCPEVEVIPPWVRAGSRRTRAGSSFLMAGRLVPHKAVLDGWRAWTDAGRPLPLRVAGEGPLAEMIEEAELLGWLDRDQLRHALRGARALLFPSGWQEPFGIVGLEALAEGTPVVVAGSGGTAEWSGDGCLELRHRDVGGMARAIERIAGDPDLALELGERGRRAVAARFGRDKLAPKIDRLYRSVATSSATLR